MASIIPGSKTGLISENLVSIPPEKRMMLNAIIPINCVSSGELNDSISYPKNTPTPKKSSNAGVPSRYATLPANTATKSSIAPINRKFSVVISILSNIYLITFVHYFLSTFTPQSSLYSSSAYSKACAATNELSFVCATITQSAETSQVGIESNLSASALVIAPSTSAR